MRIVYDAIAFILWSYFVVALVVPLVIQIFVAIFVAESMAGGG